MRRPTQNGSNGPAFGFGVTHVPTISAKSPLTDDQRAFFESWK
jgi:hypothetical protein